MEKQPVILRGCFRARVSNYWPAGQKWPRNAQKFSLQLGVSNDLISLLWFIFNYLVCYLLVFSIRLYILQYWQKKKTKKTLFNLKYQCFFSCIEHRYQMSPPGDMTVGAVCLSSSAVGYDWEDSLFGQRQLPPHAQELLHSVYFYTLSVH